MHFPSAGWQVWQPTDQTFTAVTPGCLVGWDYRPWRVISMTPAAEDQENPCGRPLFIFVLRPLACDPTDTARSEDVHVQGPRLPVLPEHFSVCGHCGDVMPCRTREAARRAPLEMDEMRRYETAGICPACGDPITLRQKSLTLPNVKVPLGPPVTFHTGRQRCARALARYRRLLADPSASA
ncbi:hypothetical protein [Nocardia sp. IFM 10818]